MSIFKCKMCGGTIEFNPGDTVGVCDSCGTKQTLPRLDDDRKANLYDRANHFRRNNDFDKAAGIYGRYSTRTTPTPRRIGRSFSATTESNMWKTRRAASAFPP